MMLDAERNPTRLSNLRFPFLANLFWLAIAGCAAMPAMQPIKPRGYLHFQVKPENAIVYVDEKLYGEIRSFPTQTIALAPGTHRIEIRASQFESERFDIDLNNGEDVSLSLHLIPAFDIEDRDTIPKKEFLKRKNHEQTDRK